eukprot:scaffold19105_cov71-Skeletonema_dohrnii-CCMP3373.AAC.1
MKLFTALFLAISAHNQSPANAVELPNLRGVADIALTDGETSGESRGHHVGVGQPICRKETDQCSTSTTTSANLQCCNVGQRGTTQALTCNPADISSLIYDGICVAASAPGEDTAPVLDLVEEVARYNKNGAACVGSVNRHCSTAQDAQHQHRCCSSVSMDLTCAKNDTVTVTDPAFDGKCVDASGDVCHDFAQMKINCNADLDPNMKDVTKCYDHWAYEKLEGANCNVICDWNHARTEHICVLNSGEDEESQ